MSRQLPPVVLGELAPHIAAEVYRAAGDRPVILLQVPARPRREAADWLGPIALVLSLGIGISGLVLMLLALIPVATAAAAALTPTVGGVTLTVSLTRRSKKG